MSKLWVGNHDLESSWSRHEECLITALIPIYQEPCLSLFAIQDKKVQVTSLSGLLSHIGGVEVGLHSLITLPLDGTSALIINS